MGGWNKGIPNSTGSTFKGKRHTPETIAKMKVSAAQAYTKPQVSDYIGTELCMYGCEQPAKFQFKNKKLCCSKSYNSCPGKIKKFQDLDHTEAAQKSLATRLEKGITKSSRSKAIRTMRKNGTYETIAEKMRVAWETNPWENNTRAPLTEYKETGVNFQGSYEYKFLEHLESKHGINWISDNVQRGPSLRYYDTTTDSERLYISDFIIGDTVYEIKSRWTWNKKGKDPLLEQKNYCKLRACIEQGYKVILVLEDKEIKYA